MEGITHRWSDKHTQEVRGGSWGLGRGHWLWALSRPCHMCGVASVRDQQVGLCFQGSVIHTVCVLMPHIVIPLVFLIDLKRWRGDVMSSSKQTTYQENTHTHTHTVYTHTYFIHTPYTHTHGIHILYTHILYTHI